MRLIDADALIEEIRNKIPVYRVRNTFMSFVDDMPTAYDPEKVVEEVKDYRDLVTGCYLREIIEIVRKGGVE